MQRYCREKADPSQVYIWTEQIAKKDELEEVWATDAEDARSCPAAPRIETIGPSDLATMKRRELMAFGIFRCDIEWTKEEEQKSKREDFARMICDKMGWTMPKMVEIGPAQYIVTRADGEDPAPAEVTKKGDSGAGERDIRTG